VILRHLACTLLLGLALPSAACRVVLEADPRGDVSHVPDGCPKGSGELCGGAWSDVEAQPSDAGLPMLIDGADLYSPGYVDGGTAPPDYSGPYYPDLSFIPWDAGFPSAQ